MFPIGKLAEAMALGDALLPDRVDNEDMGVTPVRAVQDLGSALRQTRKALDLTQSELALAAGVGVRSWWSWRPASPRCGWSTCCG